MNFSTYNSFLSDLYKKGLDYACERAVRLGFGGVELLDFCPLRGKATYELYTVEQYRSAFEKYGLELACYSSAALLYTDDEEGFLEEIFRQADFTAALGGKFFHHTFTIGLPESANIPFDTVLERVAPVAEKIARHCEKAGLTCLYEPQGIYFNGVEGLSRLYDEMRKRAENIGICGDVGNPLFVEEEPACVIGKFAAEVKHVHVKDYIRTDAPIAGKNNNQVSLGGKYLFDCEIGQGIVDFANSLDGLKKVGYDGWFSIEFDADDESTERMIAYMKDVYK